MDEAAAAYRRFQEEEHTRRVLAQISERPCGMTRTRTFEEARERWRAADGRRARAQCARWDDAEERSQNRHVLSLSRIRREEVALRGRRRGRATRTGTRSASGRSKRESATSGAKRARGRSRRACRRSARRRGGASGARTRRRRGTLVRRRTPRTRAALSGKCRRRPMLRLTRWEESEDVEA